MPIIFLRRISRSIRVLLCVTAITATVATLLVMADMLSVQPFASILSGPYTLWNTYRNSRSGADLQTELGLNFGKASQNLGIVSSLFVVSLPRRSDRKKEMEKLRAELGIKWTYVTAIDAQAPVVEDVLVNVMAQRLLLMRELYGNETDALLHDPQRMDLASFVLPFHWPDNIDGLSSSNEYIPLTGSDFWFSSSRYSGLAHATPLGSLLLPQTCAVQNHTIPKYTQNLPQHLILSAARIACWHSHQAVIRSIVNAGLLTPSIILEDDIDMEWDISERLSKIWKSLPADWDIVFLGHCWSDETYYPPIGFDVFTNTSLHPSRSPLCTHAYALSPRGARRILLHLLHPQFAFSRAFDQALAWLIHSKRIKGFSVVPSIIIQRKLGGSDIMPGKESKWKEDLVRGVLGRVGRDA